MSDQHPDAFERLFRMDLVGLALINRQTGVIEDCNASLAAFFGRSREDLVGRHLAQFETSPPARDGHEGVLVKWASGAAIRSLPIQGVFDETGTRRGWLTIEPMPDVEGREPMDAALIVDVTTQFERDLEARQTQRLEAVGQLAAGIAHDFNNLLAVISGYAELLEPVVVNAPDHQASLEEIKRAASRAVKLVHGLLAFGRQSVLDVHVVDLHELIAASAGALQDVLGPQIQVELRLLADRAHAETDALQFEHVLLQLATNARDAMPDGGRLLIETRGAGSHVRVTVSDTGVGMQAATLERVFEPFFTTKDLGNGMGLGLATVYGIVAQSHGRVTAASEPGRGTTVTIELPMAVPTETPPAHRRSLVGPTAGIETILLAPGDSRLARLIESFLTRLGYRVIQASTDDEARRTVETSAHRLDLMIAGLRASEPSGHRVLGALRAVRPDLPAVLISSAATDEAAGRVSEPSTAVLREPFTMSDLATRARLLLDRSPA